MAGEVIKASGLDADLSLSAQVCIVGSGAGGAVLAARLSSAGISVVMLEAGPFASRSDFDLREDRAMPLLYQDRGTRMSGDGSIAILQGRSVGGGTTINWTTCYRTPERILDQWRQRHGIKSLSAEALEPHFEAVERRLSISTWPEERANANNRKLLAGARALGWQVGATKRNVKGCADSGYCGLGCPVDGKQAMHVTAIPDALRHGMILVCECPAIQIEREGDRAVAVVGRAQSRQAARPDGVAVRVQADVVVVSGGALNSPALLLRSQLNPGGRVGMRTFIHPVIAVAGRYADPVNGFYGAPQSVASHQFVGAEAGEVGFFFETAPVHPLLTASAFPGVADEMSAFARTLAHTGILIALHVDGLLDDDAGGVVSLRSGGLPKLDYPTAAPLRRAMKRAHQRLAELTLAAGAEVAQTLHVDPIRIHDRAELTQLEAADYGAFQHAIFSAHQMGGCSMGDSAESVVDEGFRLRGMANLFVVDGSVLPTALGVNPSETIYAIAHLAAEPVAKAVGVRL